MVSEQKHLVNIRITVSQNLEIGYMINVKV